LLLKLNDQKGKEAAAEVVVAVEEDVADSAEVVVVAVAEVALAIEEAVLVSAEEEVVVVVEVVLEVAIDEAEEEEGIGEVEDVSESISSDLKPSDHETNLIFHLISLKQGTPN